MNSKSMDIYESDIVSDDIDVSSDGLDGEESILSKIGRWVFYAFLLLFPLWFLPGTISPIEINKSFLAGITLSTSLMLLIGGMLQEGVIRFPRARFFWAAIAFIAVWTVAALFSSSPIQSLWGVGSESLGWIQIVVATIALFVSPLALRDIRHVHRALLLFAVAVVVQTLFFFVQSVGGIDVFSWEFAQARSFNLFGSWNALSTFFGLSVALFLPFVGLRFWASYAALGCAVLGMFFANFPTTWVVLGIVALFFVALSLSHREQKTPLFGLALVLLILSVLFVLLTGTLASLFEGADNFGKTQEVIPAFSNTVEITKKGLAESPILGTGPNTFGFLWDKFKDPAVNTTIFWQTRFTSGFSTFLQLVLEGGILGTIAFAVLIGLFLANGVHALSRMTGPESVYVRGTFAASLYLVLMWFLYPLSGALVLLTFVFLGLFYAALRDVGVISAGSISLFETKERGFIFSLILIFALVSSVAGIYFQTVRYLGSVAFARGVDVFNREGAVNTAMNNIRNAIELDRYQDRYYRTAAQLQYVKMTRILNQESAEREKQFEEFRIAYNAGRTAAELARDYGKKDALNYRMLGQIYELAIPFEESTSKAAIENYETAISLSPNDPSIHVDLARTYLALSDITILRGGGSSSRKIAGEYQDKAIGYLSDATNLKQDYAQAHFTLSRLYLDRGQLDEAIGRGEAAVILAPDNVGALFQLGFLYYQKENFDAAERILGEVVRLSPNYSNARYFLGLIYDRKGNTIEALKEFESIAALNPDNAEVGRIIEALRTGKKAADVLGEPPPEKRKEAPLPEEEQIR
ncbi:MAG: tetratricopeptide repeat protein [Patescibacteria group bacterium]